MHGHFRVRMAWLHGWAGLLVGWLLYAICLTGTAAYWRDELSLWMRPELHAAVRAADRQSVPQAEAAATALRVLARAAPQADSWIIDLPTPRQPLLGLHWSDAQGGRILTPGAGRPGGRFRSAWADPHTGAIAPDARSTRGGDFFYSFHFTLHYLPVRWGRWIAGVAGMAMLVALATGVVAHRRLFADFFTFRQRRGQRSWLDAHNLLGVLALPYHAMIAFSGLVALMFLLMPWGLDAAYGAQRGRFFAETLPQAPAAVQPAGLPAVQAPLAPMLLAASQHWGGAAVGRITVQQPGDAHAQVVLARGEQGWVLQQRPALRFDGASGALRAAADADLPAASATRGALYALHLGRFADTGLRALLFLSGLLCSAAVATGLLLWTAKRPGTAPRAVQGLNTAAIAGLPLAMAAHLVANRLLPVALPQRADLEVHLFFAVWALSALAACARPGRAMWRWQLGTAALLFGLLPWLDGLVWLAMPDRMACMHLAWLAVAAALAAAARRLR